MFNADVPEFEAFLRKEYLYNQKKHVGEFIPCVVFGVASVPGRAIGFHLLTENGAQIARVPIHMIVHDPAAPKKELEDLELWNSFSSHVCVHEFSFLSEARARVLLPDRKIYLGNYVLTIDWIGSASSDNPGEIGHKNAHLIELDDGNYALQPNNRIFWHEPSFVTKPFTEKPDYETNRIIFNVENQGWKTSDDDRMFYEIEKAASDKKSRPRKKEVRK
jgi:hypothetical protein